jgi:hypothetical protein
MVRHHLRSVQASVHFGHHEQVFARFAFANPAVADGIA